MDYWSSYAKYLVEFYNYLGKLLCDGEKQNAENAELHK